MLTKYSAFWMSSSPKRKRARNNGMDSNNLVTMVLTLFDLILLTKGDAIVATDGVFKAYVTSGSMPVNATFMQAFVKGSS